MDCTAKTLKWVGRFEQCEELKGVRSFERARSRSGWASANFNARVFALAPPAKAGPPRSREGKETSSRG